MQINDELLCKLERLCALEISQNERENVKNALTDLLKFADILNEIDTSAAQKTELEFTPLRSDEVRSSSVIEGILAHAPARDAEYFSVPKIIE